MWGTHTNNWIKNNPSLTADLLAYMKSEVAQKAEAALGAVPESQRMALDIMLKVKVISQTDGSFTYEDVTKENFPDAGMDIILPYPTGTETEKENYEFEILHLVTVGDQAGRTESFNSRNGSIQKTKEGLKIHISSASPFAIAWQTKDKMPAEPDDSPSPKPDTTTDNNDDDSDDDVEKRQQRLRSLPRVETT